MSVIIDEEAFAALAARGYEVVLKDGEREVRVVPGMTVEELPKRAADILNEEARSATRSAHRRPSSIKYPHGAIESTDTPGIYITEYGFPIVEAAGPYTPPDAGHGRVSEDYLEYLAGKS